MRQKHGGRVLEVTLYLTGDTHREYDSKKLGSRYFGHALGKDLTRDDYVLICGDFGYVWETGFRDNKDNYWLGNLQKKNWTTLFIDGNHDNHQKLASYSVEQWHGGSVHMVRPNIIHLLRGEIYDINGKSFFCMGGALSSDIGDRKEGISWWPEEIPNKSEREHAWNNLQDHDWEVDYVITHTPPTDVINCMPIISHGVDEYTDWLQAIANKLTFEKWFFGHMHQDMNIEEYPRFEALYNDFYNPETATRHSVSRASRRSSGIRGA